MSRACGAPRPPQQLERLLNGREVLEQYSDQQSIEEILHDRIKQDVVEAGLRGAGPIFVGLADERMQGDPFGLRVTRETYLRNVNSLAPGFQVDPHGVPFGQLDFMHGHAAHS